MHKLIAIFIIISSVLIIGSLVLTRTNINPINNNVSSENNKERISPFALFQSKDKENEQENTFSSPLAQKDIVNILLLGIDRRSRVESSYRTDIMILMSINKINKKIVMTSVPRDLWVNGGRINGKYIEGGWQSISSSFEQVAGMTPDRFILTDFKDFSWLIDALGGVEVYVDTTFSDSEYPIDETYGIQTISFTQGPELLTGERALIYSRSRKGNNGEGSDWMRMRRQHKILKAMPDAVLSPRSLFNPMVVENAFNTLTTGKMDTNVTLSDAEYFWSFYKDRSLYKIESFFLDSNYVYSPPMEEYGGAWVLIPQNDTFIPIHTEIQRRINSSEITPESTMSVM